MNTYLKNALIALVLLSATHLISQQNQTNDTIVSISLDEVVLSIPFNETVNNNVLRVNKLNVNGLNIIKRQNFASFLKEVPGLSLLTTGPGIAKPVIRGLTGNRVVVFNQYIRQENQQWGDEHGLDISPFGVGSIEVIKGPMSVLYGSDAIGGVLYVNPDTYSEEMEVELGSYYNSNYSGVTTNVGVKGSINNLNYLFQGSMVDNKDFETPHKKIEGSFFEQKDFKIGLGYKSDKFITDLRVNVNKIKVGIPHGDEHDDHDEHGDDDHDDDDDDHDDDHEGEEHGESYQDLEHTNISWKNTFMFDNNSKMDVTLGYSANSRKEFGEHEEEGHDDDHGDDDDGDDDHDDEHDEHHEGEAHINMDLETTSFDLKYTFPKTEKSEFIVGSSILSQENLNLGEEKLIPDAKKNDFGLFGLGHLYGESWDVIVGARLDFRNIKKTNYDENFSSFTTSLGYKKDLSDEAVFRLNFSTGYRAPTLNELFSDGVHHGTAQYEVGDANLDVEKNSQIDISFVKFNDNSKYGFELFHNKIKDFIYLAPDGTQKKGVPVYNYYQTDASIYGGEFYVSGKTGLDWLSYKTSMDVVVGKTSSKKSLPRIPPLTIKQSFDLEFGTNSFEINALVKARRGNVSQFETPTNSYFLMNIYGKHELNFLNENLNLSWSVNNLFDTEYFDHLSRLKNFGIHEMGRNISIGFNYLF